MCIWKCTFRNVHVEMCIWKCTCRNLHMEMFQLSLLSTDDHYLHSWASYYQSSLNIVMNLFIFHFVIFILSVLFMHTIFGCPCRNVAPPKTVLYLIGVGVNSQVGDCLVGLCHQGGDHWLKNLLGRYARWIGSPGTLKSWLMQMAGVGRTP